MDKLLEKYRKILDAYESLDKAQNEFIDEGLSLSIKELTSFEEKIATLCRIDERLEAGFIKK